MNRLCLNPVACVLPILLTLSVAWADVGDRLKDRLGSDKGAKETFWALLDRTVDLEASFGLWQARLSGGLTALTAKLDEGQVSQAIDSISAGEGLVREVRFGLRVGDNKAFFSYLSDQLFNEAEAQVKEAIDSRVAREIILRMMAELRPDLSDYLPPKAKAFMRVQYGRFIGGVDEPWRFSTRGGRPWFGGAGAEWRSDYFSAEVGLLEEEEAINEFGEGQARRRRRYSGATTGVFLRFSRMGRPLVLGFGNEAGLDANGFILEDATLDAYSFGLRFDGIKCDTICWRVIGDFVPFTGVASLDLGRFGNQRGAILGGGGELRASLPINMLDMLFISPYASIQAE
ncbi:hypothetical protein KKF91_04930, partial [Myxococcota bacterium]|nr:hypothetical protein [Myxococcota bacterium]